MSRIFFSTFLKFSSGGGRLPEAGRRLERAETRRRAGTRESMGRGATTTTGEPVSPRGSNWASPCRDQLTIS